MSDYITNHAGKMLHFEIVSLDSNHFTNFFALIDSMVRINSISFIMTIVNQKMVVEPLVTLQPESILGMLAVNTLKSCLSVGGPPDVRRRAAAKKLVYTLVHIVPFTEPTKKPLCHFFFTFPKRTIRERLHLLVSK